MPKPNLCICYKSFFKNCRNLCQLEAPVEVIDTIPELFPMFTQLISRFMSPTVLIVSNRLIEKKPAYFWYSKGQNIHRHTSYLKVAHRDKKGTREDVDLNCSPFVREQMK